MKAPPIGISVDPVAARTEPVWVSIDAEFSVITVGDPPSEMVLNGIGAAHAVRITVARVAMMVRIEVNIQ
jgi:hypothetical protein